MATAMRMLRLLCTVTALAGCARSDRTTVDTDTTEVAGTGTATMMPTAPPPAVVTYTGFGPVRVGMTVAEAQQALGDSLRMLGPAMEPCHYVKLVQPPVAFMVIDGRIARVDVQPDSPVKTLAGAGVGDSEERVRALYPGFIEVQPHKYTDGRYLIVRAPDDSTHRIIFETDGQRVTSFRGGRMPEVRWVEGCS
jgi:hypothetical protein